MLVDVSGANCQCSRSLVPEAIRELFTAFCIQYFDRFSGLRFFILSPPLAFFSLLLCLLFFNPLLIIFIAYLFCLIREFAGLAALSLVLRERGREMGT